MPVRATLVALGLSIIVAFTSLFGSAHASPLKKDEEVILFPALATPTNEGSAWKVTFHGWVFEPGARDNSRPSIITTLGAKPHYDEQDHLFNKRARWFAVDNERGKRIDIRFGGNTYPMPESGPNGHFRGDITVPATTIARLRERSPERDMLRFDVLTPVDDNRAFSGKVYLINERGLSVISDIDDTIKISEVNDKQALLTNTFLRAFRPVPGMAKLYRHWALTADARFHYVSASPWQLYVPLTEFMQQEGFPAGSFHLKDFRWKDSTFLNLYADPVTYKTDIIESLLTRFPRRSFVLIGDSGERDPETYGQIARKHPGRIHKIAIRHLGITLDETRYRRAFADLDQRLWTVFHDPAALAPLIP